MLCEVVLDELLQCIDSRVGAASDTLERFSSLLYLQKRVHT